MSCQGLDGYDLQVSPNGTVEIYIACSKHPYDLHHDIGLSEFFADMGKIDFILEGEFGFSYPVEHFYEWHIVRVDYNYDIEKIDLPIYPAALIFYRLNIYLIFINFTQSNYLTRV